MYVIKEETLNKIKKLMIKDYQKWLKERDSLPVSWEATLANVMAELYNKIAQDKMIITYKK